MSRKKRKMQTQERRTNGIPAPLPMQQQLPDSSKTLVRVRMIVSPSQAKDWLAKNTHNRNISGALVNNYAKEMTLGMWRYNPADALVFTCDMVLINGQHRLEACAKSGQSFDTDVVFNAELADQDIMDAGRKRTAADAAKLKGVPHSVRVSALARLVLLHRQHGISKYTNTAIHPTQSEIIAEVYSNPKLQDAVTPGKKLCAPSIADFCLYVFREYDAELANTFMTSVMAGANLNKDNPACAIRDRLIDNIRNKAKLPTIEIIALFFKAWKLYRESKPVKALRWNSNSEGFPEI